MRLIDADRLLTDKMKSKYYHLPNGDIAIPLIDIEHAPTIEPEPHEIGYLDCSNALLKMWIDNVLTDGEYKRIADRLSNQAERRITDDTTRSNPTTRAHQARNPDRRPRFSNTHRGQAG